MIQFPAHIIDSTTTTKTNPRGSLREFGAHWDPLLAYWDPLRLSPNWDPLLFQIGTHYYFKLQTGTELQIGTQ